MTQYMQDGDASKLAETVDLHPEALLLRPQGHRDRAVSLNNLANALWMQYKHDGNIRKLAETVNLGREALSLFPRGHPRRASSLSNLAITLLTQYKQDGDTGKLAETVGLLRKTLLLRSQGHPDRAHSLSNLANALETHYDQDGDTSKLAEVVDLHREALSLRPQGNPDRGDSLSNLSNSYHTQFKRNGDEDALNHCLLLRRDCLNSWLLGHPNRYTVHDSVARVQLMDSSLFNWAEALNHLMQAMTDNGAPPRQRLISGIQSLRWLEMVSTRHVEQYFYSQRALDVYVAAIQLLPRVAHAGVDLSARLRELSGSEQLCRAAAMRAILLNQLPVAVEVFEEGKAVF
jgi:hypothetical protein